MDSRIEEAAKVLASAKRVLFITGAGLSADSGLPTYRGVGGLYDVEKTEDGMSIETALSGPLMQMRPDITWKYLWQIGEACFGAKPNRGHDVMAAVERAKPDTWVLTQNVDGLHHEAGSKNLIELHGRADELFCLDCGNRTTATDYLQGYAEKIELPPKCAKCGGLIRPDVVLFGEMLPIDAVRKMQEVAEGPLDMVFSVGTSSLFPYITAPVQQAIHRGIPTVEINPGETALSHHVDFRFQGRAAETLDALWTAAS